MLEIRDEMDPFPGPSPFVSRLNSTSSESVSIASSNCMLNVSKNEVSKKMNVSKKKNVSKKMNVSKYADLPICEKERKG